jgi:hypothetical protein
VSNELSNYCCANGQSRLDDPGSFGAPGLWIDDHLACFTPKKSPHHAQVGGSGAVRRVSPDNPMVSDLPRHHLHAWRFLLEAGVMPTYAHMSLIRTAHESALLAYWLVEPGSTPPPGWPGASPPGQMTTRSGGSSRNRSEPRPRPAKQVQARQGQTGRLDGEATELGLTKPNKHGVLVLKTLSRAPLKCSTASFLPVGSSEGAVVLPHVLGYAHAKSWAMVLGARQGAPSTALGGPLPFPRGRTARLWAAPDCPWTPSNAR